MSAPGTQTRPALIRLEGVGKDYPIAASAGNRLRTLYCLLRGRAITPRHDALSNIGFEVYPGQSLGLIGENGAGKSTLLKIIAGVVKQSRGTVAITGKVGALLELGAGFHPEYSGRDNVFLATALMGMTRQETRARLDEILAFADIGDYIDQPIKHYSSGMVVRLGFAVATTMRPDILITDEVLAVGDESFQKKCVAWMENYLSGGGTLLLCSHSMFHIQKLCRHAVWIHRGHMRMFGAAADVTREYLAYHEEKFCRHQQEQQHVPTAGVYQIRSLELNGRSGSEEAASLAMGETLLVQGTVHSPDGRAPSVAIGVVRADGTPIYGLVSDMEDYGLQRLADDLYGFGLEFPQLSLLPGRYTVRAHAMDPEGMRLYDQIECRLDVTGSTREMGVCRLDHVWRAPRRSGTIPPP